MGGALLRGPRGGARLRVGRDPPDGGVDFAREQGASGIEGYPLDVEAAEHVTPDELFGGTVAAFEQAGFRRLAGLGPSRAVMLLTL